MDSEEVKVMENAQSSPKVEKKTGSGLGRQVMNAVRQLQGQKGAQGTTLASIKSFLCNARNVDTKQKDAEIKMYLKKALDRGQLIREAGNYKVAAKTQKKSSGRRKRSAGAAKASPKRKSRKLAVSKSAKKTGKPRAKRSKKRSSSQK
ncbi:histone H1C-like [Uloborus diversus]|uniref:histone H1C-like n=1 Tax=Uloborus diversus TaxID=327109 RepID=UPI00240A52D1|nr:histone H1C-like [Uloborus diversus]